MKSLIELLHCVLEDSGTRCGTSTTRDWKTVTGRLEAEGFSFVTITLPGFCKDFERSLDRGMVDRNLFQGFAFTGGLPRFLGGFLDLIFDRKSGVLLDAPSIEAIRCVRQITLLCAKIEAECTPQRDQAAIDAYIKCEQDVHQWNTARKLDSARCEQFARIGSMLWADYFSSLDNQIWREGIVPKHGPGATADRLTSNGKYNQREWTERLERVFPHWELLIPSESFLDEMSSVTILEPGQERPSRLALVPKTQKTPRLIAIEPTCMQYVQQGVFMAMSREARVHYYTRAFVLSDSQVPNQELAREGSTYGSLATLDLSEASDRVSYLHVAALLANHPNLFEAVFASRTTKVDVRGEIIHLAKFASMGSALCFPFEALVFMTIVFCGIENALNTRLTHKVIKSLVGKVRAYGDDIIVPTGYVLPVIEELEANGFKVNHRKSFWTGKFRESCGAEFYDGHRVTAVKARRALPDNRRQGEEVVSAVSLRNQLFHAGYDRAVEYLDKRISGIIPFPQVPWYCDDAFAPKPTVYQCTPLLGRHEHSPCQADDRDDSLQVPVVKGAVVSSKPPVDELDGYGALMKWFLMRGESPVEDENHLHRAGRPDRVHIKIRWAPLI